MNRLLTLTFFSIFTTYSFAQISVNRDTSVDVYESNTKYKSAEKPSNSQFLDYLHIEGKILSVKILEKLLM